MTKDRKWRLLIRAILAATFGSLLTLQSVFGADQGPKLSQQRAVLMVGGRTLLNWTVSTGETRTVVLPNGFRLGIRIQPVSRENYARVARSLHAKYLPEAVEITLFDLTAPKPHELTHTVAGSNSAREYGPHENSGRVDWSDRLDTSGVTLLLNKANYIYVGD